MKSLQKAFRYLSINDFNKLLEVKLPEMSACNTCRATEICLNW